MGDGPLLLANCILIKPDLLNSQTPPVIIIPSSIFEELGITIVLSIYVTEGRETRTHLYLMLWVKIRNPKAILRQSGFCLEHEEIGMTKVTVNHASGEILQKNFASKFHLYSLLPLKDMNDLCNRVGVVSPVFEQALESVVQKCSSCYKTENLIYVGKLSLIEPLLTINDEFQIDFVYVV